MSPEIGQGTWVAPNATLTGDVQLGKDCSVWYQAVIRGDVGRITIGNKTNVQDGAVIHATTGKSVVTVGDSVTIGHRAIVHGCEIADNALIGMGSIVLDNAKIGEGAIVAAGAVVLENTLVPPGTIWAGVPAVQVKQMDTDEAKDRMKQMADGYVHYKDWYV
jgi:carbonic anhydrase/acetyltransferase-like protein (isoleucine patch superfamily)